MTLQRRLQLVGCNTEDQWMATALKVAFATSDMKHVDQHFGAAQSFAIYAVDQEKVCFVEANEFGKLAMDGNEDKLAAKIAALDGCIAVYSQAVGASAIQQLKAQGIQPVKVSPGSEIRELLENLQEELRQGPSSWLAKAIASTMPADSSRFDQMEDEGWEE
ncbi:MAG: NifB/NifX family molybdenum-iron cluster-binding protein [Sedimenticola sp.]